MSASDVVCFCLSETRSLRVETAKSFFMWEFGLIVVDFVFLLVRDDAAWASIFVVGTICKVDL